MDRPFWIKLIFFLCVISFIGGLFSVFSPFIAKFTIRHSMSTLEHSKEILAGMDQSQLPPDFKMPEMPDVQKTLDLFDSPIYIATAIMGFLLGFVDLIGGVCLRRMEMRGVVILRMVTIFRMFYGTIYAFIGQLMLKGISYGDIAINVVNWSSYEIIMIVLGAIWYPAIFLLILSLGDKSQLDKEI